MPSRPVHVGTRDGGAQLRGPGSVSTLIHPISGRGARSTGPPSCGERLSAEADHRVVAVGSGEGEVDAGRVKALSRNGRHHIQGEATLDKALAVQAGQ